MKKNIFVLILLVSLFANELSAFDRFQNDSVSTGQLHKFNAKGFIAPAALIGLGAVGSVIDDFKEFDFGLRPADLHHHKDFVVEDVLQYVPLASMYALRLSGVKSPHSCLDATVLAAGSYCITGAIVFVLKKTVDERRPNGKDFDSFPSGHAAKAFAGAELLRLEYKDVLPAIGYAGYVVAAASSLLRIKHSEHWLPDVLAGAGIGILGTKVAWWVCPHLQKMLFGKWMEKKGFGSRDFAFMGVPFCTGDVKGVSLALVF